MLIIALIVVLYVPHTEVYTVATERFEQYMAESGNAVGAERESMRIGFILGYMVMRESLSVFILVGVSILAAAGLVSFYRILLQRYTRSFPLANPRDSLKNILSHMLLFSFGIFNRRASEPLRYFFDRPVKVKILALLSYALIFFSITMVYDFPAHNDFLRRYYYLVLAWPLYPVTLIALTFFVAPLQQRSSQWLLWLSVSGLTLYFMISFAFGAQLGAVPAGGSDAAFEGLQILNLKDLFTTLLIALAFSFYIELMKSTVAEKSRMETELRFAQRIQNELIPEIATRTEEYEIFGRTESAHEVGGDMLDTARLKNGSTAIAVADVSGHSIASGLLMSMLKTAFRTELTYFRDPQTLAGSLNSTIHGNKAQNMFISFLFGIIDSERRMLSLVNCGHPPLLHMAASDGSISRHRTGNPALGLMQNVSFAVLDIAYQPGDVFVLFSDGLAESTNAAGEEWGVDRLEETLREHRHATAIEMHDAIVRRAAAFRKDVAQRDDVTLMVLRMH